MGRPPACNCHCVPDEPPPPSDCDCPDLGTHTQFQDPDKERILVMQICNTNAARDDNMRILLNGIEIDAVLDHNANQRTGAIYVSDPTVVVSDTDPVLVCLGENHELVRFDPSILVAEPANNALTAELVQANNNGNYGRLVIASFPMPYVPGQGCIIMEEDWSTASSWNYQFRLCEE